MLIFNGFSMANADNRYLESRMTNIYIGWYIQANSIYVVLSK